MRPENCDEPTRPSEDDRRALLAAYSSAQLQYPAVAVASVAALIAELVGYFGQGSSNTLVAPLFLAFVPPTLVFVFWVVSLYLLERKAVYFVLHKPLPTWVDIRKELTGSKEFDPPAIDSSDGLRSLDRYYTHHMKEAHRCLKRLTPENPVVMLLILAFVLGCVLILQYMTRIQVLH